MPLYSNIKKQLMYKTKQHWDLQYHVAFTESTKLSRRLRSDLGNKDSSSISTGYTNANSTFLMERYITRFWPDNKSQIEQKTIRAVELTH